MIGLAAGLEATGVLNVVARFVLGRGSSIWLGQVGGLVADAGWGAGRAAGCAGRMCAHQK
jgi:hypothetical protein